MNKLQYSQGKTLKLTNVLFQKIILGTDDINMNSLLEQMQTYIKVKGSRQIGPLIQHTKTVISNDKIEAEICFMLQCNNFINKVEEPYYMESVIRATDCLYCRYTGPEESLKFAYDKINLEAFENNISLSNESYTIFVDKNVEESEIVADVFIPVSR